ncbi:MAG: hypothetical protein M0005_13155 [Actinomycetota bacterium]|nr:hypothetical protein [Actinomycetota bacterium]
MSAQAGTGPGQIWPEGEGASPAEWPASALGPLEGPHAQPPADHHQAPAHEGHPPIGRHGHGWMMIACCIPMIAIAVALVTTGVAGAGFILVALACTAMMAAMHLDMGHGGHGDGHGRGGS